MKEEIEKVLSEDVRPQLAMDGGNVELVDVSDDGVVKVKLTGHCATCPMAQMTLTGMVEKAIKAKVPQVQKVEAAQ